MRDNASGPSSSQKDRNRRTRHLLVVVLAAGLAVLTACGGSALTPQAVRASNEAAAGKSGDTGPSSPNSNGPGAIPTTGSDVPTGPSDPSTTGSGPGGSQPSAPNQTTGPANPVPGGSGPNIKAGSCAGFKNQKGITDSTIQLGNSSDVSGPVPGLFEGAQLATKAYVAYFNSTSTICGRHLALTNLDSRTDALSDQSSYLKMCESDFASVGSMSAFDSGGAKAAQDCGLPDMRAASVTGARNGCTTCFSSQNTGTNEYTNSVYDFWTAHDKAATTKAAYLYLNAGSAAENAITQIAVGKKRGMNWVYTTPIDIADFNYGPYVQQMKSKGVQFVQFLGAYQQAVRLAQAMAAGDFHPRVLMYDPSVYDQGFLKSGGAAVEGAYMFLSFLPLNSNQPEIALYRKWLDQVSPGAQPTFFGLFAWTAAKLFVEKAVGLGGNLTRANLVAQFKTVHAWTGGGATAEMDVGGKHAPSCVRYMKVVHGQFVPYGGNAYLCHGYTHV